MNYCSFVLPLVNLIVAEFIEIAADHYTFLRNCPPTPPLGQHFALSET